MAWVPPLGRLGGWRFATTDCKGLREIAIFAAAHLVYFGVRALTEGSVTDAITNADWLDRTEGCSASPGRAGRRR